MKLISYDERCSEISFELGKTLYRFTPPIIINPSTPELVSSSVLLKFNGGRYLVTAGHVFKSKNRQDLKIPLHENVLSIEGTRIITEPNMIDDDRIDLAIYKLRPDAENILLSAGFLFYDLAKFNSDHLDMPGDNYIAFGHPVTRSETKLRTHKFTLKPFNYRTKSINEPSLFSSLGINKESHQILYYRKRKIHDYFTDSIIIGPDAQGMSGCGVWCVTNFLTTNVEYLGYYPTGIVIEYHKERSALVATRINFVTELIRKNFDSSVRRSRFVDFNQSRLDPIWS